MEFERKKERCGAWNVSSGLTTQTSGPRTQGANPAGRCQVRNWKEYDKALVMLNRALDANKSNPNLLTDVATSYLGRFYQTSNPKDLQQSKKLLEKAVKLDATNADALYKLAISSYYLQEYTKAWDSLHKSVKKDKKIADQKFITALLRKQPDPKGIYKKTRLK